MEVDYKRPETVGRQPVEGTQVTDAKEGARALALGEAAPERIRAANGQFATEEQQKAAAEDADNAWFANAQAEVRANTLPDIEQAPDANAKADAPEQATESKASDEDKEAIQAALIDAKRLEIPPEVLEAMSPDTILKYKEKWSAQVAEKHKVSRELGELRKQIEATKANKEAAPPQEGQPAQDLDALVNPFVAEYDEATRNSLKGIAKVIHSQAEAKVAAADKRINTLEAKLDKLQQASGHAVAEDIRGELKGKFPQLGKAAVWDAVLARADRMVKLPEYQDNPRQAIEHALRIESASFPAAEQVSEPNRGKRNGVASTSSQAPRAKAPTQDDIDRAAYAKATGQTN